VNSRFRGRESSMNSSATFHLRLFGTPSLSGEGGAPLATRATQRHRIALLALLSLAPGQRLSRDKLMSYLWPERGLARARNLLNVSVYVLRRELGDHALASDGDTLKLNTDVVRVDVVEFEAAVGREEHDTAVTLYQGPFLDGFFLNRCAEFERWVEGKRDRLGRAYAATLEALARAAEEQGTVGQAVEWWKARAEHDPYDSRVAVRLMQAMDAAGNRAGALQHAASHLRLLEEDFATAPPLEVLEMAERLRHESARRVEGGEHRLAEAHGGAGSLGSDALPRFAPSPPALPEPGDAPRSAPVRDLRPAARLGLAAALVGALILGAIRLAPRLMETAPPSTGERSAAGLPPTSPNDVIGRAGSTRETDVAAQEFFLRGSDLTLLRTESGSRDALQYLRQATVLDSTFAAPFAALAGVYVRLSELGVPDLSRGEALTLAEEAALTAITLDDSLASAHAALGIVRLSLNDFAAAEGWLRQALALDPRLGRAREHLASAYLWTGRPAEALAESERALEFDPLSPRAIAEFARALAANGRCDEALEQLGRLAALEPPLLRAGPYAAQCYAQREMWPEAMGELGPGWDQRGPRGHALFGYLLARAGETDEAQAIRDALHGQWRRGGGSAFALALIHLGLGDLDQAFAWIERAIDDHSLVATPSHIGLMEPLFHELREDPRFARVRARLGIQHPLDGVDYPSRGGPSRSPSQSSTRGPCSSHTA
jgi:DNA-binding SARP family transcriptional activator